MESKWPGKRIQAELPFMAHVLYNHCESDFKTGNKPDDLAAPSSAVTGAASLRRRARAAA